MVGENAGGPGPDCAGGGWIRRKWKFRSAFGLERGAYQVSNSGALVAFCLVCSGPEVDNGRLIGHPSGGDRRAGGFFPSEALLKNFREAKWAGGTSKSEVK